MIKSFKSFSINESALDKDWGWFDPDYKLYSFSNLKRLVDAGKIQNPGILERMKDHYDFIGYITNGKITSSPTAIKQGWVRWMITEGENLYVHFEKNVTDRKKFLESFMAKMKTPYKGVVIEVQDGYNLLTDYGMDLTPAQFIEYFDTEKLWSFRDRKERRLNEKQLHDKYKEWGLVAPSGKFYSSFDPMFEEFMDENNPLGFLHFRMWEFITTGKVAEFDGDDVRRKKVKNFEKALDQNGWIRWAVEKNRYVEGILNIDCNLNIVKKENLIRLLRNVSAEYSDIVLDVDDPGPMEFDSRSSFVNYIQSELYEEPHEIMWYRDWGYVAPDGEVVSGLLRPVIDTHEELLRDIVGEKKYSSVYLNPYTALQNGFVRWFTFKNYTGNYILSCLCMMGKDIDKKILKLYRHVKKDVNFIEIDLMLKDKKTHKFFSGSNIESVLAEFSEFVNKGKQ